MIHTIQVEISEGLQAWLEKTYPCFELVGNLRGNPLFFWGGDIYSVAPDGSITTWSDDDLPF